MTVTSTLAQYGKHFQECVVQALLTDHVWAEQMTEVFDVNYFELKYLHFLAERYFTYVKKYKVFPTLPLLVTIIKDELKVGNDVALRDQVVDYLQRIRANSSANDLPYVKEKTLDFARKQALKLALETAVEQIQAEKYEAIVDGIRSAVMVGTVPQLGHDFFNDVEARFVQQKRETIPTGIDELDQKEVLNGGLGKKELSVIVGATGAGKSHFLVQLGASAMKLGCDVLHYTFELSEAQVGTRYDSHLVGIDANDVIENKDKVLEFYKGNKFGRLMIKEFPTNTCSILTIRNHMERLSLKGFIPSMVIIDYADIMRSTRQYDSLRHELKLIYEELRGFAMERKIAIVTASQSNKDGANSDIIDVTNLSEAYGKAMIADVILSISRKAFEKASGAGRLFVAKSRAGRDGIIYPIHIDTAQSRFEVTGKAGDLQEATQDDETEMKRRLRLKLKEIKGEKIISSDDN